MKIPQTKPQERNGRAYDRQGCAAAAVNRGARPRIHPPPAFQRGERACKESWSYAELALLNADGIAMAVIILATLWAIFGVIVAMIANAKGYEPGGWGLYGFLLFPVALVHILLKPNLVTASPAKVAVVTQPASLADELAKFEQLRSQGVITDSEFAAQKARLLGS